MGDSFTAVACSASVDAVDCSYADPSAEAGIRSQTMVAAVDAASVIAVAYEAVSCVSGLGRSGWLM